MISICGFVQAARLRLTLLFYPPLIKYIGFNERFPVIPKQPI